MNDLYLAALTITDLDQTAKQVVAVVASRANDNGVTSVSFAFLAADMAVHYSTVRRAAERAVQSGYLAVDKPRGRAPVWRVTSLVRELIPRASRARGRDPNVAPLDVAHREIERREGDRDLASSLWTSLPGPRRAFGGEVATQQRQVGVDGLALLALRLTKLCAGNNRWFVRNEAVAVIAWAAQGLDWRRIDEVIGLAETWPTRPVLPRAVAATMVKTAASAGVTLDPFMPVPPNRSSR